jgi:2-polyprenyl-3-methyl-5-hydroxy-6-metoxy-1,4-benzoquinol methylase
VKLSLRPEGLLERIALFFNLAPIPLVHTQVAFNAARAIMAGTTLGIFDALADGPKDVEAIAGACGTHPGATRHLVDCLVGIDYLTYAHGRYANRAVATKWLLKDTPLSLRDKMRFQMTEWDWMSHLETFIRTGKALDIHASMTPEQWEHYQNGMRDLSASFAPSVARALPMPAQPTAMLDIGGSHGLYSAALCRRHPTLSSTILDLPAAVERASAILAREGLGDRITYRAGDALVDDLGEGLYDLVLIANVVHHFDAAQNRRLAQRVHRALKPGGTYAIGEFERNREPGSGGAVGATSDLYFAFTSTSGTWSVEEMSGWQRAAGFTVLKPLRYVTMPGAVTVVGRKTGA